MEKFTGQDNNPPLGGMERREMKNSKWEEVARGKDEDGSKFCDEWGTARMKVPGGWLVTHWVWAAQTGNDSTSLTFLPDPEHLWEI